MDANETLTLTDLLHGCAFADFVTAHQTGRPLVRSMETKDAVWLVARTESMSVAISIEGNAHAVARRMYTSQGEATRL